MKIYLNTVGGTHTPFSEDRVLVGKEIFLDDVAVREMSEGHVVLADGVGGNRAGAVAAFKACKMISELAQPTEADFLRINEAILAQGRSDEARRGMATTLTGVYFDGQGKAWAYHVGNTRLYTIQAGMYLSQLTEDDTVVNYLVRTGKLTEDEALKYPKRNEITACFGGSDPALLRIRLFGLDLKKHRQLMLSCDGIHEALSVDEMEDIIAEEREDLALAAERLVSEAKAKGSTDDCSIVIIDCGAEGDRSWA